MQLKEPFGGQGGGASAPGPEAHGRVSIVRQVGGTKGPQRRGGVTRFVPLQLTLAATW